ncbi:type III effector protein, partial [Streptomyces sp900116325]
RRRPTPPNRRMLTRSATTCAAQPAAPHLGQLAALTDLPVQAHPPLARLVEALADNEAVNLLDPLADTHTHLKANHPELAARIDTITHDADRLRRTGGC